MSSPPTSWNGASLASSTTNGTSANSDSVDETAAADFPLPAASTSGSASDEQARGSSHSDTGENEDHKEEGEDVDGEEEEGSDEDDDGDEALCRRLAETVSHVLEDVHQVTYRTPEHPRGEPNKVFEFGYTGDATNYECLVRVESKMFCTVCCSSVRIPSDKRTLVAEFAMRANCSIAVGHFEVDFSDGEVRFRIDQHNVSGLANEPRLIGTLMSLPVYMMDKYFPAIMRVTYGGATPEEAAGAVESAAVGESLVDSSAFEQ